MEEIDWAAIYRKQAREAEHMANTASGYGRYALANDLWQFEAELKEKARNESGRSLR